MQKNTAIYDELKGLDSVLADMSNENIFTVPVGYFDELSADVLAGIQSLTMLETLNPPFTRMDVPEGYFDGLAAEIINKVRVETLGNLADDSNLAFLPADKPNVFAVPTGYFEGLSADITKKLPGQPARLVSMGKPFTFFRYAVAACVVGLLGLSLFNLFNGTANQQSADVPVIVAKANLPADAFDKMMQSVAEEDIVQYLQKNGEDVNAALVASMPDEKPLPNEDEYYLNDKALDNFLGELNLSQTINN